MVNTCLMFEIDSGYFVHHWVRLYMGFFFLSILILRQERLILNSHFEKRPVGPVACLILLTIAVYTHNVTTTFFCTIMVHMSMAFILIHD